MTKLIFITISLAVISICIRELRPIYNRWQYYNQKAWHQHADGVFNQYTTEILFFGGCILISAAYILTEIVRYFI